jgi:hypothetical protein
MLLGVHAIWAAPQHRQPNISGDDHERRVIRAGDQDRRFIGARVERFAASATCFCTSSPGMAESLSQASAMPLCARNKDARHRRL